MIEKIACKLGRNDEAPNIELAELLCENEDKDGIREIVDGFKSDDKAVASDCIKVLYEIGERKPYLISEYAEAFLSFLFSRNNRLVWGSMTALAAIAELVPDIIYAKVDRVLSAFHDGGAITVDNGVTVLSKLCMADKAYELIYYRFCLSIYESAGRVMWRGMRKECLFALIGEILRFFLMHSMPVKTI